jgi:hypothetical protein
LDTTVKVLVNDFPKSQVKNNKPKQKSSNKNNGYGAMHGVGPFTAEDELKTQP